MWLRQLEWHAALYRSAPTAGEDQMQLLPSPIARLSEIERLVRHLLVDWRRWEKLENFTASRHLRNKYSAEEVKLAFEMLRDKGIVEYEPLRRSRGTHNVVIQKRAWSQITAHECGEAARFLRKLGVHRDAFESETRLVVEASGSVG